MSPRGSVGHRVLWSVALALLIWWAAPSVANASGHCSGDFVLDQHACEVAHHGPFVAIFGGLAGLVALVGSGMLDGRGGPGTLERGPNQRRSDEDPRGGPPNTLNTQERSASATADVDPAEPGVADPPEPRGVDADREPRVRPLDPGLPDELEPLEVGARSRVEPLDPGLPDLEPLDVATPVDAPTGAGVTPLSQEVRDRWGELFADSDGAVLDHGGQQVLTIDRDGRVTDLNGNAVAEVHQSLVGVTSFVDAQGRTIEYNAAGDPMQRISEGGNTRWVPITDLPSATNVRPELDPDVATRWTATGANVDGAIHGLDGQVIARIDPDTGAMTTLDGRVIVGHSNPVGGRIERITLEGGEVIRTGVDAPPPTSDGRAAVPDADLAELTRRTGTDRPDGPETRVGDGGSPRPSGPETSIRPGPGAETNVRPAPDAPTPEAGTVTSQSTPPPEADAPGPPSDETPRTPDVETPPAAPEGPRGPVAETPRTPDGETPRTPTPDGDQPRTTGAPDGPRGAGLLGHAMDAQGAIDQIQREMGEGRSAAEALTRAAAMTHVGNALGDQVTTNLVGGQGLDVGRVTDVRVTLLGSAMLPGGVNNLLPDQMAANTIGTGWDAVAALAADAGSSLGGGAIDTTELDQFTQRLADRPGADPWAGYARLGDLMGEEMGTGTGFFESAGNLGAEAWEIREDIATEMGHSMAEFGQSAAEGRHGGVLQGYAELAQAAGDPPDPAQFGRDLLTMAEVAWDDTVGGETGGFGEGFWEAQAEHVNQTVRGIPVVGAAFDGYAQIASGIEEQGAGFGTEMTEGAYALGAEAAEAASNAAARAVTYLGSWF